MAAVSNRSPLILYSRIGELDLLHRVFEEILIPPAVRQEVLVSGAERAGTDAIAAASWIVEQTLAGPRVGVRRFGSLDIGEAEAIALALDLGGKVTVLLDDRAARRTARSRRLRVLGSGGVLGLAKELGLIPAVRPHLDRLKAAGLYLSDTAYAEILAQSGE